MKKPCNDCGQLKELEEYHPSKSNKDKRHNTCKECWKIRSSNRYYANHEENKAKNRKNWAENVEEKRAKQNARMATPEFKAYRRDYLKRYEPRRSELAKKRYANDPLYRIRTQLRNRFRKMLKNRGIRKRAPGLSLKLLGCSLDSFKIYLQSKFEPGMTWENYGKGKGKWTIDHIIPCALFDLTKPEHQAICFHFSNLQPMWGTDNFKKSTKVLKPHQIQFPI